MSLLWSIIRKTFSDIWGESFLVILFNILWVVGSAPGLLILGYGALSRNLYLLLGGLIALLPWPFMTFSLFHATYDIVEEKAVGFGRFFSEGRRVWRPAYVWGGLNLVVIAVLVANISFYSNPDSPLGGSIVSDVVSSLFVSITIFWLVLQLFTLTMYPRLENPGLRDAFRVTGRLILRWPVPVLLSFLLAMVLCLASIFVPIFPLLITFSMISVLANRTTAEILIVDEKRGDVGKDKSSKSDQ